MQAIVIIIISCTNIVGRGKPLHHPPLYRQCVLTLCTAEFTTAKEEGWTAPPRPGHAKSQRPWYFLRLSPSTSADHGDMRTFRGAGPGVRALELLICRISCKLVKGRAHHKIVKRSGVPHTRVRLPTIPNRVFPWGGPLAQRTKNSRERRVDGFTRTSLILSTTYSWLEGRSAAADI